MKALRKILFTFILATSLTAVACGGSSSGSDAAPVISKSSQGAQISMCASPGLNQLTLNGTAGGIFAPHISKDGSRVTFLASRSQMGVAGGDPDSVELFSMSCDDNGTTQLSNLDLGLPQQVTGISFSDDGMKLVAGVAGDIVSIDTSTGALTVLGTGRSPVISRDGTRVAYVNAVEQLVTSNADGSNVVPVTGPGAGVHPTSVSISADNVWVIFSSSGDLTGDNPDLSSEVFVALTDVPNALGQFTYNNAAGEHSFLPTITIDNQFISYQSNADYTGMNPDGSIQVFAESTVDRSRKQVTNFSNNNNFLNATVNDDSDVMAVVGTVDPFGQNANREPHLFILTADGVPLGQITSGTTTTMSGVSMTADGQSMVFYSDADPLGTNTDKNVQLFYYNYSEDLLVASASSMMQGAVK